VLESWKAFELRAQSKKKAVTLCKVTALYLLDLQAFKLSSFQTF